MRRKIIFLFLALMLPGLIFLFLKKFGKNEFAIPLFYAHSADSLNAVCGTHYKSPYTIPDSILSTLAWSQKKASVFLFNTTKNKEISRLSDLFAKPDFDLIVVKSVEENLQRSGLEQCVFFVPDHKDIVLVDDQKRIRGYYNSATREEVDRLVVEMKILLKQY